MADVTGLDYINHPVRDWGDRLLVPDAVTPFYWQLVPPKSVWSSNRFDIDMVSVGQRDFSLSESIRDALPGYNDGTTDFIAQGFVDIQGWIIQDFKPIGGDLDGLTPRQLVDDYIKLIANPSLDEGQYTADEQLVTLREGAGDDYDLETEQTQEAAADRNAGTNVDTGGVATRVPAVIDMAAWYDLGPRMFYNERIFLGMRHENAMPVGEQKQRYAARIRTNIDGKGAMGKYAVIIFTASMPHMHAGGTPFDEADEQIAPFTDWDEMIAMYQNAPLSLREMVDEVSIQGAARQFQADAAGSDGSLKGLWGPDYRFDDYIQASRRYYVKPETWVQLPLLASIRVDAMLTTPFMLAPGTMPT